MEAESKDFPLAPPVKVKIRQMPCCSLGFQVLSGKANGRIELSSICYVISVLTSPEIGFQFAFQVRSLPPSSKNTVSTMVSIC